MKKVILVLALLMAVPSIAQNEGAKFRKIDSLLTYLYENNRFMGSLSIREKDRVVFEKAYGFADAARNIPADANTKYKVGSITKMFTSAVIFQLIEEKKLTLDTKLAKFYPQVKNADRITIAQLLSHQSGIFNYTNADDFESYSGTFQTKEAMLARIAGFEPAFEPGTMADYSNSNYILLGYIIEDITKKTYKDVVTERVIKKAGLKNTYYYAAIDPKRNEAYSYSFDGKWVKINEWNESLTFAAGGLQSTPSDLTQFIKALFDGKIIKKESLDQMAKVEHGYGRGIFNFAFGERKFFGHTGGIEGFSSSIGYYPKEEMSIALIQNGDNYDSNDIMIGILSIYYKLPYPFPNVTTVSVSPEVLKGYEGIYSSPDIPLKIEFKYTEGKLMAQATGQGSFPLNPLSDTEFNFDPAGIYITFTKGGFTLKQGGMVMDFKKEK